MTTTITLAGIFLLAIAVTMSIFSVYGKDESKRMYHSVSADIYFASFMLLVALYSAKPKVINQLPAHTDTVIVRDTIFTHTPNGGDVISGIRPQKH